MFYNVFPFSSTPVTASLLSRLSLYSCLKPQLHTRWKHAYEYGRCVHVFCLREQREGSCAGRKRSGGVAALLLETRSWNFGGGGVRAKECIERVCPPPPHSFTFNLRMHRAQIPTLLLFNQPITSPCSSRSSALSLALPAESFGIGEVKRECARDRADEAHAHATEVPKSTRGRRTPKKTLTRVRARSGEPFSSDDIREEKGKK